MSGHQPSESWRRSLKPQTGLSLFREARAGWAASQAVCCCIRSADMTPCGTSVSSSASHLDLTTIRLPPLATNYSMLWK